MELTDRELLHRFTHQRDAEAFAALVVRHGPMVLGVCRRVLGDGHGAEDALQATFLILARKAGTIRERETMGHWLYQVAVNVARRLRRQEHTRAVHAVVAGREATTPQGEAVDVAAVAAELRPIIDQELAALPAKLREAVVLCYLEGQTYDEAAAVLHVTPDAVRGRLARARELLRSRLARRGLAVSAVMLGLALAPATAPAAVPAALVAGMTQLALTWAAGTLAATAPAAGLAQGLLWSASIAKVKLLATAILTLMVVAGVGAWAGRRAWRPDSSAEPGRTAATTQNTRSTPMSGQRVPETMPLVYRGAITAVQVQRRRLTVQCLDVERTMEVPVRVPVRVNDAAAVFEDLKVGMTAELAYDGSELQRVNAHEDKATPTRNSR